MSNPPDVKLRAMPSRMKGAQQGKSARKTETEHVGVQCTWRKKSIGQPSHTGASLIEAVALNWISDRRLPHGILADIQKLFGGKVQKVSPLDVHTRALDRPDEDTIRGPLAVNLWDFELHRELLKLCKFASVCEESPLKLPERSLHHVLPCSSC